MSQVIGLIRHVAKSRKAKRCSWCDEMIEVGQPKVSWLWKDDGGYVANVKMHPECHGASVDTLKACDNYEFTRGDYSRGCGCLNGACECDPSSDKYRRIEAAKEKP